MYTATKIIHSSLGIQRRKGLIQTRRGWKKLLGRLPPEITLID